MADIKSCKQFKECTYRSFYNRCADSCVKKSQDFVLVVRCKDCIYSELAKDGDLYCDGPIGIFGTVGFNDFCSCGERKDNG